MAKLKLLIDHSLEDNATRLIHFTKFLEEKSINENSEHVYQDVILKNFASARESVTRSHAHLFGPVNSRAIPGFCKLSCIYKSCAGFRF